MRRHLHAETAGKPQALGAQMTFQRKGLSRCRVGSGPQRWYAVGWGVVGWGVVGGRRLSAKTQDGIELITTEPAESAYSNEYIEKALAELEDEGVELGGECTPIDMVLTEGGQ